MECFSEFIDTKITFTIYASFKREFMKIVLNDVLITHYYKILIHTLYIISTIKFILYKYVDKLYILKSIKNTSHIFHMNQTISKFN